MSVALRREAVRAETHAQILRGAVLEWDQAHPFDKPEPVIEAQRAILRRRFLEADSLRRAADAYERCGRDWLVAECSNGHQHRRLKRCGLVTICPDCARDASDRMTAIYSRRIRAALAAAPPGIRPRMVTLALRPHGTETLVDAFERCLDASAAALRILYGIPRGAREWRVYFQLHELAVRRAVARTAERTRAGRRRTPRAREREAKATIRKRVQADRLRRGAGWINAAEFGERGMKAHAHAYVLGRYVRHREISRCWELLTGSYIVHVQRARGVREVVKYAVKMIERTAGELAKIYAATCGRRRIEAAGVLRAPLPEERAPAEPPTCPDCGQPLQMIGELREEHIRMGIRSPPEAYRFRRRRPV